LPEVSWLFQGGPCRTGGGNAQICVIRLEGVWTFPICGPKSVRGHNDGDRTRVPVTRMPIPCVPISLMPEAVMPIGVVETIIVMIVAPVRLGVLAQR